MIETVRPTIVLDASVAARMIGGGDVPDSLGAFVQSFGSYRLVVPALWQWEVANAIVMQVRAGLLDEDVAQANLRDFARFGVETDPHGQSLAWTVTVELAKTSGLTVYDAAYLELAHRRRLPLATLDGKLANAARAEGIEVIGG